MVDKNIVKNAHGFQCYNCIHNIGDYKCDAFPDGIPSEISSGEHDHTEPFKGDNGILFQDMFAEPKLPNNKT